MTERSRATDKLAGEADRTAFRDVAGQAESSLKYSLPRFPDRDGEPACAAAAHADRQAALRWVIANGFDSDGRAAWALARLEGRPAGKEPPPRSADHERYLRQLGLYDEETPSFVTVAVT
jgi:hypothetical protein